MSPSASILRTPPTCRAIISTSDLRGCLITGADAAGLFYGACTLLQLITARAGDGIIVLPGMRLVDWPDFPNRGVMLDVSRDRVPTTEMLYELVDLLASWKINQLQLYMEHTFAYQGHEVVWKNASPFTGEEILALDAYCSARFVELIPNQNSFGHMQRWLIHEPYRQMAECPEGCELWPGHPSEPYSLCPVDPRSIELLEDLYDQLLPHFSSTTFNVGLDETYDLGKGRSAEACATLGTERVYLDFLKQIHRQVMTRGKTMQFWGDIILHQPDLIPELPADAIAMEWGYEASHPFEEHCEHFAEAGLRFYVCPGTSSWNAIAGRTENALGNIQRAASSGKAGGAVGLLNTDWGDNGHLQPPVVSILGYMAGAAASWNAGVQLGDIDLPALLDLFAFRDSAGEMGRVAYDLGNVYQVPGVATVNSSIFFDVLMNADRGWGSGRWEGLTDEGLESTLAVLEDIRGRLSRAAMDRADADLVKAEFSWVADLLSWSAQLGLARIRHTAVDSAASLPAEVRFALGNELGDLTGRYRALWLQRSRPGGLADSAAHLERVVALLVEEE